jgi:hypothetical protein
MEGSTAELSKAFREGGRKAWGMEPEHLTSLFREGKLMVCSTSTRLPAADLGGQGYDCPKSGKHQKACDPEGAPNSPPKKNMRS